VLARGGGEYLLTRMESVMHDPLVAELITRIGEGELRDSIYHLAKDPLPCRKANYTRAGQSVSTLDETDEFVAGKLVRWGYSVGREAHEAQAFRYDEAKPRHHTYSPPQPDDPWYTVYNLNARRAGTHRPGEIICRVAHKDSPSWIDSPGAHDNAVGTAGALEIARVLAGYQPRRSLWFLFCNEEHTPWTSVAAAQAAKERGDDLIAIINLDALAGKSQADREAGRKTNVTLYTVPEGEPLARLMAEVNETYGIGLEQSTYLRERPNDDDGSFVKAGFPAAIANFGSYPYADPNYHEPGDTAESVDVANVHMTVQATLAAVLTLDRS
jgi:Zn-dependent M28 family amino/carboxypeptidase